MTDALFELETQETKAPSGVDWESLRRFCFLYTASQAGGSSGIRFMMTEEDAHTWCESPKSRARNGVWIYCFTSVENFVKNLCEATDSGRYILPLKGLEDNGMADADIHELGVTKIPLNKFATILGPLGIECVGEPIVKESR